MVRKVAVYIALVAAGAFIGATLSGHTQSQEQLGVPMTRADPQALALVRAKAIESLHAQFDPQIEQLLREIEVLRKQLSESGGPIVARPHSPAEQGARIAAIVDKIEAERTKRSADMLLAAGYSPDRIDWFRKRSEELQRQRRLAETARRAKGLPVDPMREMAYVFDQDIELRYELGDDEYARYLQALGKPTNVQVAEVLPDSIADAIGIRIGDVILDYDGKRLFNLGELNGLAMGRNGQSATITVSRSGQTLKFVVPSGIIGIRSGNPSTQDMSMAP